ncbi:MAG: hypothetical protein Q4P29_00035 [Tissierellia bacterium]|nr:hypothetical protein [Tissierellia bacterium]
MNNRINISKREKILLGILITLIIVYIYINYFRMPKINDINLLKAQYELSKNKSESIIELKKEIKELEETDALETKYNKENFANFKYYIESLEEMEGLKLNNYDISEFEDLSDENIKYYRSKMIVGLEGGQDKIFEYLKNINLNNDKIIIKSMRRKDLKSFDSIIEITSFCLEDLPKFTKINRRENLNQENSDDTSLLESIYKEEAEEIKESNAEENTAGKNANKKPQKSAVKTNENKQLNKILENEEIRTNRISDYLKTLDYEGGFIEILNARFLNKNLSNLMDYNENFKLDSEKNGEYIILKSSVNQLNNNLFNFEGSDLLLDSYYDPIILRIMSDIKDSNLYIQYVDKNLVSREQSVGIITGDNELETMIFSLTAPKQAYPLKILNIYTEIGHTGKIEIVDFIGIKND